MVFIPLQTTGLHRSLNEGVAEMCWAGRMQLCSKPTCCINNRKKFCNGLVIIAMHWRFTSQWFEYYKFFMTAVPDL